MTSPSDQEDPQAVKPPPASPRPILSDPADPLGQLLSRGVLQPPSCLGIVGQIGRFQVLRQLGEGGMALVVLARDPKSGEIVAIKLLKSDLAAHHRAVERFHNEADRMSRLTHPHILRVLEQSSYGEPPFYVTPYMPGGSLAQRLRDGNPLGDATALQIAIEVAEALAFAYERHLLHRDVKPENVLLDSQGRALLADFGLGLQLDGDWSVNGQRPDCVGTAPYMSPGTAAGKPEDTRADIYAYGALLYEMLTGGPPYEGRDTAEIVRKILKSPPDPIRRKRPDAPAGLAAIADGAMAREVRDRYATWDDLIGDLHRLERGETPLGPRGCRRGPARRIVVFSISTALILTIVVIGGLLLQRSRAPRPPSELSGARRAEPIQILESKLYFFRAGEEEYFAEDDFSGSPDERRLEAIRGEPRIHVGDEAICLVHLSRPAHIRLLAIQPDGTWKVWHPEAGKEGSPAMEEYYCPSDEHKRFKITSAGPHALLLQVGESRLSGEPRLPASAIAENWPATALAHAWKFNGLRLSAGGSARSSGPAQQSYEPVLADSPLPPPALDELCHLAGHQEGVVTCRAIAFPALAAP